MKSFLRLGIALLVCFVALVAYSIWYGAVAAYSSDVARLSLEISNKTGTKRHLNSARAALAEIENDEALVRKYFVSEADAVAFIKDLEAHGRAQNATLEVLSVSSDKLNGGAKSALALSLSMSGTFDAVMRTLGAIEHAPYAVSTSNLVFSKEAGGSWHAQLSLVAGSRPPAAKPL
ncbi:hypothetical protein HYV30_02855 [Candidatus Kaiserbacteria bacterium]|nr:hypothetical protein [Candidatus Kaiserbacteria bacterium]